MYRPIRSRRKSDLETTRRLAHRSGIRQTPMELHALERLFATATRSALGAEGLDEGLPTERLALYGLPTLAMPLARFAETAVALDAFLAATFLVLAALPVVVLVRGVSGVIARRYANERGQQPTRGETETPTGPGIEACAIHVVLLGVKCRLERREQSHGCTSRVHLSN